MITLLNMKTKQLIIQTNPNDVVDKAFVQHLLNNPEPLIRKVNAEIQHDGSIIIDF